MPVHLRISDDAVFDLPGLTKALGLRESTVRHAKTVGALRYGRAAKRTWFLGRDVKAWLFGNGNGKHDNREPQGAGDGSQT